MIEYEIRQVDRSTYEIVSIVDKKYVNFVAQGSKEYCESVKRKMENL